MQPAERFHSGTSGFHVNVGVYPMGCSYICSILQEVFERSPYLDKHPWDGLQYYLKSKASPCRKAQHSNTLIDLPVYTTASGREGVVAHRRDRVCASCRFAPSDVRSTDVRTEFQLGSNLLWATPRSLSSGVLCLSHWEVVKTISPCPTSIEV